MAKMSDKEFYEELMSRLNKLDQKESDLELQMEKVTMDKEAIQVLLDGYLLTNGPKTSLQEQILLKKDQFKNWKDYVFDVFKLIGGAGKVRPVVEYILKAHPDFEREYVRKAATNALIQLAENGRVSARKKGRVKIYRLNNNDTKREN